MNSKKYLTPAIDIIPLLPEKVLCVSPIIGSTLDTWWEEIIYE